MTVAAATPTVPAAPAGAGTVLPALRRLANRLAYRATYGLTAQAGLIGVGVAVFGWGLGTGLFRSEHAWPLSLAAGLLTALVWFQRGRARLRPLRLLTHAERQLHLHELWTTAWTLPTEPATTTTTAAAPGREFRTQVETRAEAAAQAARPADLLPLRLPAHWNLALALMVVGVGAGLRPQPEADFLDADPTHLAAAPADTAPGGGGASAPSGEKPPADSRPDPAQPPPALVLTPAQADLQKQWNDLVQRLDTPEKLQAALAQFALLQQQPLLPADAIAAIEKRLREKEKALAAAGAQTAPTPPEPADHPAPTTAPDYVGIPLSADGHTINPQILQEIRVLYPEYEPALTRYVSWLADHGKPQEAHVHDVQ